MKNIYDTIARKQDKFVGIQKEGGFSMKILITPKSFGNYKDKTYPLLYDKGYEIIENNLGRTMTEDEIIERARSGVVGIIVGIDPLSERVLERCADLKAISKYGVGMDNIDLKAAERLGIRVKNAVGSNNISVAELAVALMFEAATCIGVIPNGETGRLGPGPGCGIDGKDLGGDWMRPNRERSGYPGQGPGYEGCRL